MYSFEKKNIKSLFEILKNAYGNLLISLANGQREVALSILADSQEAAIELGQYLEEALGDELPTISLLEKYCEKVFLVYSDINEGKEKVKTEDILKVILEIDESLDRDIKCRKLVLFLPYKASMWDCMETVWTAATQDDNCDAFVIPIPYYNRNSDGTFGQMVYEGDSYPDYVPVTNYETFDFENLRADAIFIHNPYDSYNKVTSIHPFFYSDNLKKRTDKLIYIPYYVATDSLPDVMCITPGTVNADKIVVQSEQIRKYYVDAFLSRIPEEDEERRKAIEDKIVALGSPKIEKAASVTIEGNALCPEWEQILFSSDGTRKRTIFYNTSVGAILNNSEQYIKKIESVFKYFRSNKNLVLWWRPHPLSKATFSSMKKEMAEKYDSLVKGYIEEGFGIYDETTNLDRAIFWSDAYYGDRSSVTMLFSAMNKPVMIQSVHNFPVVTENVIESEGKYWITDFGSNALYSMEKSAEYIEYMGSVPLERKRHRLYKDIVAYKDKLVLVPFSADEIAIFDKGKEIFTKISLNMSFEDMGDFNCDRKFSFAKLVGDAIYLFPCTYPKIVKIDMINNRLRYIDFNLWPKKKNFDINTDSYFSDGYEENGHIVSWCDLYSELVELNTKDDSIESKKIINNENKYISLIKGENTRLFIPDNAKTPAVLFDKNFDFLQEIGIPEEIDGTFLFGCYLDKKYYLFPATAPDVFSIEETTKLVTREEGFSGEIPSGHYVDDTFWKYFVAKSSGSGLYAYNQWSLDLVSLEKDNSINSASDIEISRKQLFADQKKPIDYSKYTNFLKCQCEGHEWEYQLYSYEGNNLSFISYINMIEEHYEDFVSFVERQQKEIRRNTGAPNPLGIGKRIFEEIMRD